MVEDNTNKNVAEIVYALTNEKGKTREQRANDKYYKGIKETPYATFVKLCDRMANLEYSKKTSPKMTKVYQKEMSNFIKKVYDPKYDEMFDYLKKEAKS
jgi:(p)ppGpp synthase/HD superfamily hydrolase